MKKKIKKIEGVEFNGFTLDKGEQPPKHSVHHGQGFYYFTQEDIRSNQNIRQQINQMGI